jgi:hypothetical protein
MHDRAIAFDFDGTLVHSGVDKCVHIMYAAYAACATTAFRCFLRCGDPGRDVERLLRALLRYPGAPRFQQLAAGVKFFRVAEPDDLLRLAALTPGGLPDLAEPWDWSEADIAFFRTKTRHLVDALLAGRPLSPAEATDFLHA